MEQLLTKAIYEIEDYEEECEALRQYVSKLVEGTPAYDKCYKALQLALDGELLAADIPTDSDSLMDAFKRIRLRSAINLMLRQARRAE